MREALLNPLAVERELCKRSLYYFLQYFWESVSPHQFKGNWHIEYLCQELEKLALKVAKREPREHDLIINVPPGSSKTITCSIMFPVWCWAAGWEWMRFITASYSGALALQSADFSRELIRSVKFQQLFPELMIRDDKDTKSNFGIVKREVSSPGRAPKLTIGGSRYSTSVGGTLMGFHGDILIVDDPLNPTQAASEVELANANHWMEQTLPTRKTDKDVTPIILIMQRLHQDDPSGHILAKQKNNVRNICFQGEIKNYRDKVRPRELISRYKNNLLDPVRLSWSVLHDLESALGQYGYAGQIGQDPTPPGGGMFKVDAFKVVSLIDFNPREFVKTIRYWDKAGSEGTGAYTVGVKMTLLTGNRWLVEDVRRGRWGSSEREKIIRRTAEDDGTGVEIWIEQEPGSGGKESAEGTIRNLAGYVCRAERPTGDKVFRADPYSVQVNNKSVMMLAADWNYDYIEEHRFFPYSTYKDQVDASSGAFNKLIAKKIARCLI
jgi:predicted phage terminase large subunit-like protein